ncbi:hypothetical protein Fmac_032618 [Flemingia macrophylla]|uniref:Uncharacterized protein n=1 Tax=Flemingia macrophylla TaxID=520843 RepID=A0ABD1L5E5_9FABA
MAKISFALVFALVVAVTLHSVLCDIEEDPFWRSVIDEAKTEASKAGFSQETIFEAQKAIDDGSAEKIAEEALNGASLGDWVQQADHLAKSGGSTAEAPEDSPDDEEEDNVATNAPTEAPTSAPIGSPKSSPTTSEAPSEAPQAEPPLTAAA